MRPLVWLWENKNSQSWNCLHFDLWFDNFPLKNLLYYYIGMGLLACLYFNSLILIYVQAWHYFAQKKKSSQLGHKLRRQNSGSGSSLFLCLFLYSHMYGCTHVHASYRHPNGCVCLSKCIHQPVAHGPQSQAACLFWINTLKPHLATLKCRASRRHTGGQRRQ